LARLDAAGLRTKSAQRDLFPKISLTLKGQQSSPDLYDLTMGQGFFWNAFSVVSIPLMDGGRGKAEVEDALALGREQFYVVQNLIQREEVFRKEYAAQVQRYKNGIGDILAVYKARQGLLNVQREHKIAQLQLISYRIQLFRALGGEW